MGIAPAAACSACLVLPCFAMSPQLALCLGKSSMTATNGGMHIFCSKSIDVQATAGYSICLTGHEALHRRQKLCQTAQTQRSYFKGCSCEYGHITDTDVYRHGGNNLQIADACDSWRQPHASQEEQPAASSSEGPQLPFWLLAKTTHGTWQSLPLTAWSRVSSPNVCLVQAECATALRLACIQPANAPADYNKHLHHALVYMLPLVQRRTTMLGILECTI